MTSKTLRTNSSKGYSASNQRQPTFELRLQSAIAAILCTGWSSDRINVINILSAPSFKAELPCSRFAARFPIARAASRDTRGDEDPRAFSFAVWFLKRGGSVKDERIRGYRGGVIYAS